MRFGVELGLFLQFCHTCDWIERGRNYNVIPMTDAIVSHQHSWGVTLTAIAQIHAYIIAASTLFYTIFALCCTAHIIKIMREFDVLKYERYIGILCIFYIFSSSGNSKLKISRTKQSLVQVGSRRKQRQGLKNTDCYFRRISNCTYSSYVCPRFIRTRRWYEKIS